MNADDTPGRRCRPLVLAVCCRCPLMASLSCGWTQDTGGGRHAPVLYVCMYVCMNVEEEEQQQLVVFFAFRFRYFAADDRIH